jgi:AmiR/NasT family two-component response regulator
MGGPRTEAKDSVVTEIRLTQNFTDLHAVVVSSSDVSTLIELLARFGLRTTHLQGDLAPLMALIPCLRPERDLLIVDCDCEAALELSNSRPQQLANIPVIGLINGESPSRLKRVLKMGATAVLRRPVHGATVYPALFLGINAHRQRRELEEQIISLQTRRSGRRFIIKAVIERMRTHNMDDDAAFESLRSEAQHARQTIEDYCASLLPDVSTGGFSSAALVARSANAVAVLTPRAK